MKLRLKIAEQHSKSTRVTGVSAGMPAYIAGMRLKERCHKELWPVTKCISAFEKFSESESHCLLHHSFINANIDSHYESP